MDVTEALLDSWDRQCRIVDALATRADESNAHVRPAEGEGSILFHFAHIHLVRKYWLSQFSPEHATSLGSTFKDGWETPIDDLDVIRAELKKSAVAVREAVRESLERGDGPGANYEHPVHFLQHMVWHDGWHVGLISLCLRLAGQEPTEEWEETHVWGEWRTE